MIKRMRRSRRVRRVLPPRSAFAGFRFPREVIVLAVRSMPLSLAGDFEEVDLGWAVVELAVVGGAFEVVVVGSVSFDHSGICSVPSWGVGSEMSCSGLPAARGSPRGGVPVRHQRHRMASVVR